MTQVPSAYANAIARYAGIVDKYARKRYGISGGELLAKVTAGESHFNMGAVSSAGARGATQFMPATRADYLRRYGVDAWKSPKDAIHATALYLRAAHGDLQAYNPGMPSYTKYILGQQVSGVGEGNPHADAILRRAGIASPAGGLEHVDIANKQSFDQAGFEDAQHKQILAQLLTRHGQGGSALFKTGLLSTAAPDPTDFSSSTLTSRIVQDAPSATRAPSSPAVRLNGRTGKVAVAAGANRAGVGLAPITLQFAREVSAHATHPITLTTGTNHDRMTVDGNVSDHWDGHAGDFAVPVDSHRGDLIAASALVTAGIPRGRAWEMAKQGGLFNVTPTKGPFKGHRVQVIWKTTQGGNHHNHVHIGVR